MPALRFQTCRLLLGNVRNRELTIIQRRILRKLRNKKRSIKRKIYPRENLNSYIQSQTTRKLPLFHGDLPKMHGTERTYIPFPLNPETRSDVIPVRLHFSETIPQARQPISHRRVCVNKGMVSITHFKVSHGDLISLLYFHMTRVIRRSFYISVLSLEISGKKLFLDHPVRGMWRTKTEWSVVPLLKTKRGCLKSRFLQQLRSMQKRHRTKLFGSEEEKEVCFLSCSFAEHNRMKRILYHLKSSLNRKSKNRNDKNRNLPRSTRSPLIVSYNSLYSSTYCSASHLFTMSKINHKRIELPTHYSEVNHRTLKAVVSYGPMLGHIPINHDIRLKDPNLPLRSGGGNGRGQNI